MLVDDPKRIPDNTVVDTAGFCDVRWSCSAIPEVQMTMRSRLLSLGLLALLVPAPNAQTQKPELLWQFEAGG
jgi:hypothetical protein